MIDFSNLDTAYNLPTSNYGGPMPPPGTNPSPGLPPSGSPFYQNPFQGIIQGAEDWLLGAAASLALPILAPVAIVFLFFLVLAIAVVGIGGFSMGMILND